MPLGDMKVLQVVDPHTQVLTQPWLPSGMLGSVCAPRQLVSLGGLGDD